ncbi:MAG: hypothetical protein R3F21_12225 [Myxococcota bacterium]
MSDLMEKSECQRTGSTGSAWENIDPTEGILAVDLSDGALARNVWLDHHRESIAVNEFCVSNRSIEAQLDRDPMPKCSID